MKAGLIIATFRCLLGSLVLGVALTGQAAARSLPDFTGLVEKNAPAVVNISTTLKAGTGARSFTLPEIPEGSPFHDFLKKFFGQIPEGVVPFEERNSLGSGFVISADGYVITNNHVVRDAEEVVVRFNDRREFVAEIVGTDERSDIALLKINGTDLPSVRLGDSSKVKVGEWVLAIGSPFGFEHSVTAGIVSAMGRSLPNENYVPFIQTDVAINPGNSGGPLFNLDGEVIGVNSQIYSRTGGFMGLSFAAPINVVNDVYRQLREKGRVSRGWLGVLIQDVTRELAESFGMGRPRGALVARVLPQSPAEKAGLEVGDIIVRFDGRQVDVSSDLPPLVGSTPVGSSVPIEILRKGKTRKLRIQVAELPEDERVAGVPRVDPGERPANPLNVVVRELAAEERQQLELGDEGIVIERVMPGPAANAGIRDGDVLLLLNNTKIASVADFNRVISQLPADRSVPVLIQRRGNPIFLALKLADEQ
jgi:serine protease Do